MIQQIIPLENASNLPDASGDEAYGQICEQVSPSESICYDDSSETALLYAAQADKPTPVTESRKHFSEALLMHAIMNNSQDTIYVKDLDSKFVLNSMAHARQFNLKDPQEMVGKSDLDYFTSQFAHQAFLDEQEIIRNGVPLIGQIQRFEAEPGVVSWYSASKYPLFDEHGEIIGTWGTSTEITKLKLAEEALAHANNDLKNLSRMDELSGLYNRRYFYYMLNGAVLKHAQKLECGLPDTFSLVSLDIDHFKVVNDTLGHMDGDEAILHIAKLLLCNCRSTDTVFRIGGDEYSILLLNTDLAAAKEQSERIRCIIETTPLMLRGEAHWITVSMGVSCYNDHTDINEFVRDADSRLYSSKRRGRNRVT